jgi:GNAT superfamily N-acetyltransferase
MTVEIQTITKSIIPKIHSVVCNLWGNNIVVAHLQKYDVDNLSGFVAMSEDDLVGFIHYEIIGDSCEVLTLASLREGQGVGTTLINAVEDFALSKGCKLLHLVTTNDNLHALGFYQKRGFHLCQVFPGRVDRERKIKPSIPKIGDNGIPIRDEIRLEKRLILPEDDQATSQ